MAISKHAGTRLLPFEMTATTQLLENRVVKLVDGVPSYATYGDIPMGVVTQRGDENDYRVTIMPFDYIDRTFLLRLAGTVSAHDKLFATGSVGAVKTASSDVIKSRNISAVVATTGNKYIAPSSAAVLSAFNTAIGLTATAGQIATRGESAWTLSTPSAGDIYWVEDEGIYVQYDGSTWVEAVPVALAGEAGSAGEDIMCYRPVYMGQISAEQRDAGCRSGWKIVCVGEITIPDNATSGTLLDDRIQSGDTAIVSKITTTSAMSVPFACAVTTDTVTVTCTDPGVDGLKVAILVLRKVS